MMKSVDVSKVLKAKQVKANELEFDKEYVLYNELIGVWVIFKIISKPYTKSTRNQTATWLDIEMKTERTTLYPETISVLDYNLIPNNYNDHKVVELDDAI